jgi:hypothetical protein
MPCIGRSHTLGVGSCFTAPKASKDPQQQHLHLDTIIAGSS